MIAYVNVSGGNPSTFRNNRYPIAMYVVNYVCFLFIYGNIIIEMFSKNALVISSHCRTQL